MSIRHTLAQVAGHTLHVAESGDPRGRPYLLLHGWPESWRTWTGVMDAAPPEARLLAIDLPGIGESTGPAVSGSKLDLATIVHALVGHLALEDLTLIGHDGGGMITYAYLRRYAPAHAVIMNTVIAGVAPWEDVVRNPYMWHFGLHAVPELPETLVMGRQREYFDYFYDVLSVDPSRITPESRAAHAAAYSTGPALTSGFNLYRTFSQDVKDNEAFTDPARTPLLYLRGDGEGSGIETYAEGFRKAGVTNLKTAVLEDTGHFAQEERPDQVWAAISDFTAR